MEEDRLDVLVKHSINDTSRLNEVTLLRAVLAVLIVFMHSFTIYNGYWEQPAKYIDIPTYKWLARFSFAATLEAFVFISGYLFAHQCFMKGMGGGISLIVNKLKRLILPSVVFSTAYFVMFFKYEGIVDCLIQVISGCGHMWFLPMLFWCFILTWLLMKINIKDRYKLLLLAALNLLTIYSLPLQLSSSFKYLLYFYCGFVAYKNKEWISQCIKNKSLFITWIVFLGSFFIFRPIQDMLDYSQYEGLVLKMSVIIAGKVSQLVYAISGLAALYHTSILITQKFPLNPIICNVAKYSFGMYLFQQFILQMLYYNTSIPLILGPYHLPWFGFAVALIGSFLLSFFFIKTRLGKLLIG